MRFDSRLTRLEDLLGPSEEEAEEEWARRYYALCEDMLAVLEDREFHCWRDVDAALVWEDKSRPPREWWVKASALYDLEEARLIDIKYPEHRLFEIRLAEIPEEGRSWSEVHTLSDYYRRRALRLIREAAPALEWDDYSHRAIQEMARIFRFQRNRFGCIVSRYDAQGREVVTAEMEAAILLAAEQSQ